MIATVSSTGKPRAPCSPRGLHADYVAAQVTQVIHDVNQVDQYHPAARLATPGIGAVEVALVGLLEQARPGHGGDLAQTAGGDDFARPRDQRAVPAMVADEDRHPSLLSRLDEPERALDVVGDRPLQEHWNASLDGRELVSDVPSVRRSNHNAVRFGLAQSFREVGEVEHAEAGGLLAGFRRRVDDGNEFRRRLLHDPLDVPLTD
jgi:hypothetical protein